MAILAGRRRKLCAALQRGWVKEDCHNIIKHKTARLLPIGPLASALIAKALRGSNELPPSLPHLFPGKINGRPFSGWSKAKKSLDKVCGVKGWRLHDLRRTFRTNLGKLGVAPYIAERLVNHISAHSELEQAYDIWTYLPEMRSAILLYEQHLSALLFGSPTEGSAPALEKSTSAL